MARRRRNVPVPIRDSVRRRAHNFCEKCGVKIRTTKNGSHNGSIHHRLPQRMGGRHTLSNLVLLCLPCHREVHADELHASYSGWIAWTDPDVTPVLRMQSGPGWVLLVPDGSLEYLSHQEGEMVCAYVNGWKDFSQVG